MTDKYTFELQNEKQNNQFFYCYKCNHKTEHEILTQINQEYSHYDNDTEESFSAYDIHQIIKCNGCNSVRYHRISCNSEDYFYSKPDEYFYPIQRNFLQNESYFPYFLMDIYIEVNDAIANHHKILAGIGLRALIETICNDFIYTEQEKQGKTIYQDTQFEKQKPLLEHTLIRKINWLKGKRLINGDFEKALQSIRQSGNEAAHEIQSIPIENLENAMKILENFIQHHYISKEILKHSNLLKK